MAPRTKPKQAKKKASYLYWAIVIASVLGTIVALYLWIYKITNASAMCLGSGDCAIVNESPFSEIRGIPVSVLGLIAYLFILGVTLLERKSRFLMEYGPMLTMAVSLSGVVFSAYLTYIEVYVIYAICPFCIASAVIITAIFALAVIRLVEQFTA
ncbi:MAG: vitamin K epoxide reductase family protein [Chloroflexota bacterium]